MTNETIKKDEDLIVSIAKEYDTSIYKLELTADMIEKAHKFASVYLEPVDYNDALKEFFIN